MAKRKKQITITKQTPRMALSRYDFKTTSQSKEDWDRCTKMIEQMYAEREQYPILNQTSDAVKLFGLSEKVRVALGNLTYKLDFLPIHAAIQNWLTNQSYLNQNIKMKYAHCMTDLLERKAIPSTFANGGKFSVGGLRHIDPKAIIQYIEGLPDLSEQEKIDRIECYIAFTHFLARETHGWFKRTHPINSKTYLAYRSAQKTTFKALSLSEWKKFSTLLAKNNYRDYLVALTIFYGMMRISDVLTLTINQLDLANNRVLFFSGEEDQNRNKIVEKSAKFPRKFMENLATYITSTHDQRKGSPYLFITKNGKKLTRSRINYAFAHTSKEAHIKQVSPEIIRATWLTLKQSEIIDKKLNSIIKPNEVTLEK